MEDVNELHIRASVWYEDHGLEIEAFQHATDANDVACAERLIEGEGMPLQFRGAGAPVLNWLESLPKSMIGCQTFVVGDVCLNVIVWRATYLRRRETPGC